MTKRDRDIRAMIWGLRISAIAYAVSVCCDAYGKLVSATGVCR